MVRLNMLNFRGVTPSRVASDYPLSVSLFLRAELTRLIDKERMPQKEIAQRCGVDKSRVSQLYRHGGGFGRPMVEGMCGILKLDSAEIERHAEKWVDAHPDARPSELPPTTHVERDPRYPNFGKAVRLEDALLKQAADEVFGVLKSEGDLRVDEWREALRSKARELHARARFPVEAAKTDAKALSAAEARKAELMAEHLATPSVEERAKAALARHTAQEEEPRRRSFVPSSEPEATGPAKKPRK